MNHEFLYNVIKQVKSTVLFPFPETWLKAQKNAHPLKTGPGRADLLPCIHRDLMCKQPFPLCLQVCCFFAALCPSLVVASHGYNHLSLPCTSLDPGRINTRVFQRVRAVAVFFRIPAFHESECWSSSIGKMKFDC